MSLEENPLQSYFTYDVHSPTRGQSAEAFSFFRRLTLYFSSEPLLASKLSFPKLCATSKAFSGLNGPESGMLFDHARHSHSYVTWSIVSPSYYSHDLYIFDEYFFISHISDFAYVFPILNFFTRIRTFSFSRLLACIIFTLSLTANFFFLKTCSQF